MSIFNKRFFLCIILCATIFLFGILAVWGSDHVDYALYGMSNGTEYCLGMYDTQQEILDAEALISQDYDSTYYYEVSV